MKTRKLISVLLTMLILVSMVSVSATAEEEPQVTIKKTDIIADSVGSTEGYGSLTINAVWETKPFIGYFGEELGYYDELVSLPQVALVDREGTLVFPYKETWGHYYYSDGIVTLAQRDAYTEGVLDTVTTCEEDERTGVGGCSTEYIRDKIGYYNLDGSEAFPSDDYYGITPMIKGYAFVTEEGAVIDGYGAGLFCHIINSRGEKLFTYKVRAMGVGGSEYYMYTNVYERSGWCSEGLLPCVTYGDDPIIDYPLIELFYRNMAGEIMLKLSADKYCDIYPFYEGYAKVQSAENNKYGFIDKNGDEIIPCVFDEAGAFKDGMTYVKKDDKWGYINAQNETVIPFEYDAAYGAGGGLAAVGKDGKFGLVDYNNNIVVPLEYDDISSYDEGVAYAIKDGTVHIITGYTPAHPAGDINGDGKVENADLVTIARYIVGLTEGDIKIAVEAYADMNGDGKVDNQDIVTVARKIVGLA